MKPVFKIIIVFMAFFINQNLFAQPVHIVKQQPRINGILKAITNANATVKIHANSNSVFGTGNTHPNYTKNKQPAKDEIKDDAEKNKKNKGKKK